MWCLTPRPPRLPFGSWATRSRYAGRSSKLLAGYAEAREILFIPAVRFEALAGFDTAVVAYTTDVPAFANTWGQPFVLGPGNIHVAHTNEERVLKTRTRSGGGDLPAYGEAASSGIVTAGIAANFKAEREREGLPK